MEDVKGDERHRGDVDEKDPPDLEGVVEVRIHLAVHDRSGVNGSCRELQQMKDEKDQDAGTGPEHPPGGRCRAYVRGVLVADGPRLSVSGRELDHVHDVEDQRDAQNDPYGPQGKHVWQQGSSHDGQEMGVDVDVWDPARGRWQETFQISDDVKHQKAEENQSGNGDYRLLTKGTTVETGEAAHWDTRYSSRFAGIGSEFVEF